MIFCLCKCHKEHSLRYRCYDDEMLNMLLAEMKIMCNASTNNSEYSAWVWVNFKPADHWMRWSSLNQLCYLQVFKVLQFNILGADNKLFTMSTITPQIRFQDMKVTVVMNITWDDLLITNHIIYKFSKFCNLTFWVLIISYLLRPRSCPKFAFKTWKSLWWWIFQ